MNDRASPYDAQHLKDALAADPRVAELGLEVSEVGGTMYVRGVVSSGEQRDAVDAVAREVLPDARVANETAVRELHDPKGEEPIG